MIVILTGVVQVFVSCLRKFDILFETLKNIKYWLNLHEFIDYTNLRYNQSKSVFVNSEKIFIRRHI